MYDSGKQKEGKTFHKLHVLGMNDDLWGKLRGLRSHLILLSCTALCGLLLSCTAVFYAIQRYHFAITGFCFAVVFCTTFFSILIHLCYGFHDYCNPIFLREKAALSDFFHNSRRQFGSYAGYVWTIKYLLTF